MEYTEQVWDPHLKKIRIYLVKSVTKECVIKCICLSIQNFQGETVRLREVMILSYFNRCIMWQTVYSFNNIE